MSRALPCVVDPDQRARQELPTDSGQTEETCPVTPWPNAWRRRRTRKLQVGRSMSDPTVPQPLAADRLYRRAALDALDFVSTAELAPLAGLIEQPRAQEAIGFGTAIGQRGFNIFAIGAPGARIRQSVRALLDDAARARPAPSDWVYVNNFDAPHRPIALSLPGGRAPALGQGGPRPDRGPEGLPAGDLRKRGLPEAPRRHRAVDPGRRTNRRSPR